MGRLDIKALELKFNQLTLRERIITFAALLICVLAIIYFWRIDPANINAEKAEKKLRSTYAQQATVQQEIDKIRLKLKEDPILILNNQIKGLNQTLESLQQQLNMRLVTFIQANKMPIALTKVLAKSPGIKVNYLKSLPVKSYTTEAADKEKQESVMFYKHSLEISLVGNYHDVYQYLRNLEALPDKFYWQSLQYQVTDYPLASVVLVIYTLSDQQDLVSG